MRSSAFLSLLAASALAKSHQQLAKHVARASSYKLVQNLVGEAFLDAFDFEAGSDPNGGASVVSGLSSALEQS